MDWEQFKQWAYNRYAKSWAKTVCCCAKKFHGMISGDFQELESFTRSKQNLVLKSLIALSKYLGLYTEFKAKMKAHGVKCRRQDSLQSFVRIMQANDDVLDWVKAATAVLDTNETTMVEFATMTGVRAGEAVKAFNQVVELNQAGNLEDYYNRELQSLEPFKYPALFLRRTKNVFFSFVPDSFIQRLTACDTVSYSTLRKHVRKHGFKMRLHNLRDYFSTFLVHHGVIREEVDLPQGRIGQSIFMRHYFSPDIEALRDRVLAAITKLPVLT